MKNSHKKGPRMDHIVGHCLIHILSGKFIFHDVNRYKFLEKCPTPSVVEPCSFRLSAAALPGRLKTLVDFGAAAPHQPGQAAAAASATPRHASERLP
jgi:hypothetical protein